MYQSEEPPANTLDALAHVPVDDAVDALNHIQRRNVLIALLAHNTQDDSPVVLLDPENDVDEPEGFVVADRIHLSKLVEYGFITLNRDTHEVTQGSNFDDIKPLLQLIADNADEFSDGWL